MTDSNLTQYAKGIEYNTDKELIRKLEAAVNAALVLHGISHLVPGGITLRQDEPSDEGASRVALIYRTSVKQLTAETISV